MNGFVQGQEVLLEEQKGKKVKREGAPIKGCAAYCFNGESINIKNEGESV